MRDFCFVCAVQLCALRRPFGPAIRFERSALTSVVLVQDTSEAVDAPPPRRQKQAKGKKSCDNAAACKRAKVSEAPREVDTPDKDLIALENAADGEQVCLSARAPSLLTWKVGTWLSYASPDWRHAVEHVLYSKLPRRSTRHESLWRHGGIRGALSAVANALDGRSAAARSLCLVFGSALGGHAV